MPGKEESEEVTEVEDDALANDDDIDDNDDDDSDVGSTEDSSTKNIKDEVDDVDEDEDEDENVVSEVIDVENTEKEIAITDIVPNSEKISKPFLNKYEKTRILSTRSKQLSLGAKPLVKIISETKLTPLDIAKQELKEKMIPYIIRRKMPNGKYEMWKLDELTDIYQ